MISLKVILTHRLAHWSCSSSLRHLEDTKIIKLLSASGGCPPQTTAAVITYQVKLNPHAVFKCMQILSRNVAQMLPKAIGSFVQ